MAHRAYLLDIEGTTTPIDFVARTLFPYARARLEAFVEGNLDDPTLADDAQMLAAEFRNDGSPVEWPDYPAAPGMKNYLEWLMDRDRKSTGLKSIQGRIWEEGYASGELKGELYPDVEPAMRRWKTEVMRRSFSRPMRNPITTSRTRRAAGRPCPEASPMAMPSTSSVAMRR